MQTDREKSDNVLPFILIVILGISSFACILAYHAIADGDLWARLAAGASVWHLGRPLAKDVFAFTQVVPEWVDHEWGAGLIFYSLLRLCGPYSLMALKVILALGALGFGIAVGRRDGCRWPTLCILAIPAAATILPGYVPVIRSHTLTFFFFAQTLFLLERVREGSRLSSAAIVLTMLVWANVHGGFVAGLGLLAIYSASSIIQDRSARLTLSTAFTCMLVTFINPYGIKLWSYLAVALKHPRSFIWEWRPMPLIGIDSYTGFRVFAVIALGLLIVYRKSVAWNRALPRLLVFFVTLFLSLRYRRHAPFFGIAALALVGPYAELAAGRISRFIPSFIKGKVSYGNGAAIIYGTIAVIVASSMLGHIPFRVLAPVGVYPVREVDILALSRSEGNLAVEFRWGSYALWRLYPRIKVSIDGRYEEVYPESTFELNRRFSLKEGPDWNRLLREYTIDYIILERSRTRLTEDDLKREGFELVWGDDTSALFATREKAASLRGVAKRLPERTIEPLDWRIPGTWWD